MEPIQIIPALTILNDDCDFTVRVGADSWASDLGRQIVSIIGGMNIAKKLTILTPNDTKVFKFNSNPGGVEKGVERPRAEAAPPIQPRRASERISQDSAAPPAPELVGEWAEELAAQQKAEAEVAAMERANKQDALPQQEEEQVEAPAPRKRGRSSKVAETIRSATACGRCQGAGVLDGGGQCPVCQGKGGIRKWGTR